MEKMAASEVLEFDQLELFSSNASDVDQAAAVLCSWGCCPYCTLRYLGEKASNTYQQGADILRRWVLTRDTIGDGVGGDDVGDASSGETGAAAEDTVCISCLGLLQSQFCHPEFLDKISCQVKKENFEYDNFTSAISMPVSSLLREHAIWVSLRERFPKMYYGTSKEDMLYLKDIWKLVNSAELLHRLGTVEEKRSKFKVNLNFTHKESEKECSFLLNKFPDIFKKRKSNKSYAETFTRTNVAQAITKMSVDEFKRCYTSPPRVLEMACQCESIFCSMEAIFLAGRYNKFSRDLSQTPWIVDGSRKTESSVQELICDKLQERIQASEYRFSSAGREDVDVKCLGNGRPFLVEFFNPHVIRLSREELAELQKDINAATDWIAIRDLQLVEREDTNCLKTGEMEKTKSYSALCWSKEVITQDKLEELTKVKDLVLSQKTPIRVLHRRPLASREKVIHTVSGKRTDDHHFTITLHTQAGTYIKEFVHGDLGRTTPNLGTVLGLECDILELDVQSVELDWPPRLEEVADITP